MIFTFPFFCLSYLLKRGKILFLFTLIVQLTAFVYLGWGLSIDPASDAAITEKRQAALQNNSERNWQFEMDHMTPYSRLNLLLKAYIQKQEHQKFKIYEKAYKRKTGKLGLPTLWQKQMKHYEKQIIRLQKETANPEVKAKLTQMKEKKAWIDQQTGKITFILMPPIRSYHWEDDAGGNQKLNRFVRWWELTRTNRKDLTAALIFGTRISIVVGIIAVAIALMIGIPLGALAGYFGGKWDILMFRIVEIWESMPTLFMLLFIVAIAQTKSIFLVITVIGFFGWTGFCRFTRGEFFKQRHLPYTEACRSLGYSHPYTIFTHILPNAIPPLLTLFPFRMMSAITSEAGLSFLGLGEEGSCSWGVLMDEGRAAFPGESYLLWPPAILLTLMLIAIALVGDILRDSLDPKLRS